MAASKRGRSSAKKGGRGGKTSAPSSAKAKSGRSRMASSSREGEGASRATAGRGTGGSSRDDRSRDESRRMGGGSSERSGSRGRGERSGDEDRPARVARTIVAAAASLDGPAGGMPLVVMASKTGGKAPAGAARER